MSLTSFNSMGQWLTRRNNSPYIAVDGAANNLGFTKTTGVAIDTNVWLYGANNDKVTNWVGQTTDYARGTYANITKNSSDTEKGFMHIYTPQNVAEPKYSTHNGFSLSPGTYYIKFQCCASGNNMPDPQGVTIEYSVDNLVNFIHLYDTGTPYRDATVGSNTELMHPSASHTTPDFTISSNVTFRLRISNKNYRTSTSGRATAFSNFEIYKR